MGDKGRKLVGENVLKQFPHSQTVLSMSTVIGDKKNMERPGRGNFMAYIYVQS